MQIFPSIEDENPLNSIKLCATFSLKILVKVDGELHAAALQIYKSDVPSRVTKK